MIRSWVVAGVVCSAIFCFIFLFKDRLAVGSSRGTVATHFAFDEDGLPVALLEEALRELPGGDHDLKAIEEKYIGMSVAELGVIYPLLVAMRNSEMDDWLEIAIAGGQHSVAYVEEGQPLDLSEYFLPGVTLNFVGHRAERQEGGGALCSIVNFDQLRFPDLYLRALETDWVRRQIHQSDDCGHCK